MNTEPWLTKSGLPFNPFQPRVEHVSIVDIAAGLSTTFRFGGQALYTVAQHCVLGSRQFPARDRDAMLAFLLHDAPEAWLFDAQTPLKKDLGWLFEPGPAGAFLPFAEVEARIMRCVATRFGLLLPLPACIHEVDRRMLATEKRVLFPKRPGDWPGDAPPFDLGILGPLWPPQWAEELFLERFAELGGADG